MGHAGTQIRIHDPVVVQQFVDTMIKHGHFRIDSGQNYGNGTSEKVTISLLEVVYHLMTCNTLDPWVR